MCLLLSFLMLFTVSVSESHAQSIKKELFEYSNPIIDRYLADPFILFENPYYYLYATGRAQDGRFIQIYRSKDIINWEFVRGAVERGAEGSWNRKNFWAPEVYKIDGLYYLYYTASTEGTPQNTGNRVGLAVAKSPGGPYKDRGVVIPHASIDGHLFRDSDGVFYMYYTIEHGNSDGLKAGQIFVDRMLSLEKVAGNPVPLITEHTWQEGPCVVVDNDRYILTYSTENWKDETYKVRWAVGRSPIGPFEEQGILLQSTEQVRGPGHHAFFTGPKNESWIAYHGWDSDFTARYPRIDPFIITPDGVRVDGPSVGKKKIWR
ncbi:glycoside hydrolase family 43 protein [Candidatus Latescibacterota bacterium]